jgi:hypothetical protein
MKPKQQAALEALLNGLKSIGIETVASQETVKSNVVLIPAEGWPRIRVGAGGGYELMDVRSYAMPVDVARMLEGKALLEKQIARDAKKAGVATTEVTLEKKEEPKPKSKKERKAEHRAAAAGMREEVDGGIETSNINQIA